MTWGHEIIDISSSADGLWHEIIDKSSSAAGQGHEIFDKNSSADGLGHEVVDKNSSADGLGHEIDDKNSSADGLGRTVRLQCRCIWRRRKNLNLSACLWFVLASALKTVRIRSTSWEKNWVCFW